MPLSWIPTREHSLNVCVHAHGHTQLSCAHVCTVITCWFWKDARNVRMRGIPRPWCSLISDRFPALGLNSITPLGGGEMWQHSCWKLVLTAACVFRPHSGCHYDSVLGSHLAGRVSVTCRKAHQGNQQTIFMPPACTYPQSDAPAGFSTATEGTGWDSHDKMLEPRTIQLQGLWPTVEICKETFLSMAHPDSK